ncbi:MAG: alpha/beta fold hydrolase [Planctomycetes bacterium]|nr:alpha/beta fold hydrolase [Planctomycetota bacterium]
MSGVDTPIDPRAGGRSCIVFLHGFGRWGAEYYNLAMALAQRGFVAVLPNSGQFSLDELFADAVAMRDSIALAARTRGHLFDGKLDLARMGLVGHSYGGTTCARVLARNDGYRAGIAIAPVFVDDTVQNARVPFLVLHGGGDTLIPWRDGDKVYRAATSYRDVKAFLRLGTAAQHLNVAGMELASVNDEEVWSICADALSGFLLRFVEDDVDALATALGPEVRRQSLVDDLRTEIDEPQLLQLEPAHSAKSFRIAIAAEPGPYGLALGASKTSLSTPFGELGLDPATLLVIGIGTTGTSKLTELVLDTPSDPRFIGHDFGLQALATRARVGLRLSPPVWITIQP